MNVCPANPCYQGIVAQLDRFVMESALVGYHLARGCTSDIAAEFYAPADAALSQSVTAVASAPGQTAHAGRVTTVQSVRFRMGGKPVVRNDGPLAGQARYWLADVVLF